MRKIDVEEYKCIALGVLDRVDEICRENQLTYMLGHGTLIGAVRHQGYIPWDDDIDIFMPREDYSKLAQIISTHDCGLRFLDITTSKDTIFSSGKICDTETVLYEENFREVEGYGAFVDVFILDYLPENKYYRKWIVEKNYRIKCLAVHSARTGYTKSADWKVNMLRSLAYHIGTCFQTQTLLRQVYTGYLKACPAPTPYLGVSGFREIFDASEFGEPINAPFEGRMFKIPCNADAILRKTYGDYKKLPPKEERINKHHLTCYVIDDDYQGYQKGSSDEEA